MTLERIGSPQNLKHGHLRKAYEADKGPLFQVQDERLRFSVRKVGDDEIRVVRAEAFVSDDRKVSSDRLRYGSSYHTWQYDVFLIFFNIFVLFLQFCRNELD